MPKFSSPLEKLRPSVVKVKAMILPGEERRKREQDIFGQLIRDRMLKNRFLNQFKKKYLLPLQISALKPDAQNSEYSLEDFEFFDNYSPYKRKTKKLDPIVNLKHPLQFNLPEKQVTEDRPFRRPELACKSSILADSES